MTRRKWQWLFWLTGLGLAAWWLRPSDRGAAHDAYFARLNQLLRQAGQGRPVLVLDLDRLDHNLALLRAHIQPPRYYRVVAKSLPSLPLLQYIFEKTGSRQAMVFHEPAIHILAATFPNIDLLLGKPMPVQAVEHFYATFATSSAFDPAKQLQWLVDSPERLAQYAALAASRQVSMQVNIEIDVGLHRGGLRHPQELPSMLSVIAASPWLKFSGLMGYDAHVASAPTPLATVQGELQAVLAAYNAFVAAGKAAQPTWFEAPLTLNGAGSKTYKLYKPEDILNDLAVGSALVKPSDFDVPTLVDHQPALYIATPVLKKLAGTKIPYLEFAAPLMKWWNPNLAMTYFIYGGGWLADYVSPQGLQDNSIYGFSTNQAIVNASGATQLEVDDYIFLRPKQSEQVMQMFSEILAIRAGQIVARWPTMGF